MSVWGTLDRSLVQTAQELSKNKLRSGLSLLGIAIGIMCMVAVYSAVNSLETNVRGSVARLGDDVVYVAKWPWQIGGDYPYHKYIARPEPNQDDLKAIQRFSKKSAAAAIAFDIDDQFLRAGNRELSEVEIMAVSHNYDKVYQMSLSHGRFFTTQESASGDNVIVIGATIAEELFGTQNAIGRGAWFNGRKVVVVGVLEQEGQSLLNWNFDDRVLVPYDYLARFVNTRDRNFGQSVVVQAAEGISLAELKDELTGILRQQRRLHPGEDDDFALNQVSIINQGFDVVFVIVNLAGTFIGLFALLVGGFGIANIMFVSVRERTNLIGVKKALGAKSRHIMTEFLIEAVMLCVIGGVIGIGLVQCIWWALNSMTTFHFFISTGNLIFAMVLSTAIGLVSGLVPALNAAQLDPVEAIRQ